MRRIVWRNLVTMWLTQLVGYCFLLAIGYSPVASAIISGLVTGFSFGICDVPLTEVVKKNGA